jgi:hypothetical protein
MSETVKKAHFVTFYSPGTFVSESSTKPINAWDIEAAKKMARGVHERHGACPYGFQFTTRGRGANDLDSSVIAKSPMYYLGGVIETLDQVKRRATEKDRILVANMEGNGYDRIITNTNSWRFTAPLNDTDVVLEWHAEPVVSTR